MLVRIGQFDRPCVLRQGDLSGALVAHERPSGVETLVPMPGSRATSSMHCANPISRTQTVDRTYLPFHIDRSFEGQRQPIPLDIIVTHAALFEHPPHEFNVNSSYVFLCPHGPSRFSVPKF